LLTRGAPAAPDPSADSLLAAATAGGRYLATHVAANGRFVYELALDGSRATDPNDPRADYSLPRHAGATYYLAQIAGATHDPRILDALDRAAGYLVALVASGRCTGMTPTGAHWACVVEPGHRDTDIGAAALTVVALAETRDATGDSRYDATITALAEWILLLQKPNGRFAHLYDVPTHRVDAKTMLLYYDGEAALALVRAFRITHDARFLSAAERALDTIIAWYGKTFATHFFFGEEHWTCIAAEAAWPDLQHDRYRRFCADYATYLRTQQLTAAGAPGQEDLAGGYSIAPFFVPYNTPTGSRTEAMISAYLLGREHGTPDERIRRQVLAALGYLLRQQIRPESDFASPVPDVDGAMPESPVDRTVRIDFVQHTCSAMLRARALFEQ
jgi:hypothetical protein